MGLSKNIWLNGGRDAILLKQWGAEAEVLPCLGGSVSQAGLTLCLQQRKPVCCLFTFWFRASHCLRKSKQHQNLITSFSKLYSLNLQSLRALITKHSLAQALGRKDWSHQTSTQVGSIQPYLRLFRTINFFSFLKSVWVGFLSFPLKESWLTQFHCLSKSTNISWGLKI